MVPNICSMSDSLGQLLKLKVAKEFTPEQKNLLHYIEKLESLPLEEFDKTLECAPYQDRLVDILNFAIKRDSEKVLSRIMICRPEAINEEILQKSKKYCNKKIQLSLDRAELLKFCTKNKEDAIKRMVDLNKENADVYIDNETAASFIETMVIHNAPANNFLLMSEMESRINMHTQMKSVHELIKAHSNGLDYAQWLCNWKNDTLKRLAECEKRQAEAINKQKAALENYEIPCDLPSSSTQHPC